jgi:hypothetical protein
MIIDESILMTMMHCSQSFHYPCVSKIESCEIDDVGDEEFVGIVIDADNE